MKLTKTQTVAEEINRLHNEVMAAVRTTVEKAIRIGELLTQAKADLEHGQWLMWLKGNVPFNERTAQRYMAVYERRAELKSDTVSDLTDAYRLLAGTGQRPAGPEPAPSPVPEEEDDDDEPCDTEEDFFHRGLQNRSAISVGDARYEDAWANFTITPEDIAAARRAAEAWNQTTAFLTKLWRENKTHKQERFQ